MSEHFLIKSLINQGADAPGTRTFPRPHPLCLSASLRISEDAKGRPTRRGNGDGPGRPPLDRACLPVTLHRYQGIENVFENGAPCGSVARV